MKATAALVCGVALAAAHASKMVRYGPRGCVSVSLSAASSCVIRTNCEGIDTSNFDFAFDCTSPQGEHQHHDFGVGGFDDVEEFDTGIKCQSCTAPGAVVTKAPPGLANSLVVQKMRGGAAARAAGTSKLQRAQIGAVTNAIKYGPKKCVSVRKAKDSNHCIMQTQCKGVNTTGYEYGLICVNKSIPEKHLFGKNSFDPEETFDTLIACNQCQGLEDIEEDVAVNGRLVAIAAELKDLSKLQKNVTAEVEKLGKTVFPNGFPTQTTTTTTTTTTKAKTAKNDTKFLLHHHTSRQKRQGKANRMKGVQVMNHRAKSHANKAQAKATPQHVKKQAHHVKSHVHRATTHAHRVKALLSKKRAHRQRQDTDKQGDDADEDEAFALKEQNEKDADPTGAEAEYQPAVSAAAVGAQSEEEDASGGNEAKASGEASDRDVTSKEIDSVLDGDAGDEGEASAENAKAADVEAEGAEEGARAADGDTTGQVEGNEEGAKVAEGEADGKAVGGEKDADDDSVKANASEQEQDGDAAIHAADDEGEDDSKAEPSDDEGDSLIDLTKASPAP